MRSNAPRRATNIHVTCVSRKVLGAEKVAVIFCNTLQKNLQNNSTKKVFLRQNHSNQRYCKRCEYHVTFSLEKFL